MTVHDGADPNADLTLRMSLLTFSLFWNGQFSLADAVDSGRICVDNIDALATFSTIFHLPDLDAGSP